MKTGLNLAALFDMQRKLDEHIEKEHPRQDGEDRLAKKILALVVELGELANEWRGFKFWSNDQNPRTVKHIENRKHRQNPLLEEYVDCLHFLLSIGLEIGYQPANPKPVKRDTTLDQFHELFYLCADMYYWRNDDGVRGKYLDTFEHLLGLGEMLGFTWEQIEEAYMKKNVENHRRQEVGY